MRPTSAKYTSQWYRHARTKNRKTRAQQITHNQQINGDRIADHFSNFERAARLKKSCAHLTLLCHFDQNLSYNSAINFVKAMFYSFYLIFFTFLGCGAIKTYCDISQMVVLYQRITLLSEDLRHIFSRFLNSQYFTNRVAKYHEKRTWNK